MSKKLKKIFTITLTFSIMLILSACQGSKSGASDPSMMNWDEIVSEAKGSTVNFYMWGGDTRINKWVDDFAAERLKEHYGIKLNRVPMNAEDFMNKLTNEKAAGKEEGSIDLLWINGENFYAAKENSMLYGPFADKLPNYERYLKTSSEENTLDFGYPTEGYEVPYGRAQFVFVYDEDKIQSPPKTFSELTEFIKNNPGKFTYPAPPDFTGSAFVRNVIYHTTGGYEQYLTKELGQDKLNKMLQPAWNYFNEIKPYFWREGKTYPATVGQLENMFADGELLMTMTYMPLKPAGDVIKGTFPKNTRTFVIEEGTIYNTHFLAIPQNAADKCGAMVAANLLIGFEAQLSKLDPANWGDLPVFDVQKLNNEEKKALSDLQLGEATLPQDIMSESRVPEIPANLIPIIEEEWIENVAK
ncbi:ABC transporter substrate-binding protein [Lutispora sp.]|uniref:ABC transporter substrate-binding protein n=1 Tax=Lutispora sp. TaxID=2828727 RepID=UPI002B211526|nr:ABC transporter substrate-binding protein [Lutispora sp.]MEA4962635.1 ABC transporter substrate-binding protein [Lutispora sp.]